MNVKYIMVETAITAFPGISVISVPFHSTVGSSFIMSVALSHLYDHFSLIFNLCGIF